MFNPVEDGDTHINIYSKAQTHLGTFLSNFFVCNPKVITEDGPFTTIEGYWYWLTTWDERLRTTNGWESKKLGRELRGNDWFKDPDFKRKILKAITIKILSNEPYKELMKNSDLPFVHYYVYNGKVITVSEGDWLIQYLEFLRKELKEGRL